MEEFETALARAAASGDERDRDTAASLAAARSDWARVAAAAAARVVRECGTRGWQGADLARMAGRDLEPRHRRLAEALTAEGDLEDAAAAFAAGERLDRFSTASACVELLCLWMTLPRIPALTAEPPAPSRAGDSKMLARVRTLLAKAESTGFPEEAEALSAKAQHLMAKHSIDDALVAASGAEGGTGPGARRIGVDRPYEGAKALLLDAVATANACTSVWSADFGFSTVVGHQADLEAVEVLYTSLLVQADRALHGGRSARSRDFRESFLISYASRVRERLTVARDAAVAGADTPEAELLPVLAARDLAVRAATRRLFPHTTSSRLKGRDPAGWAHGREAADRATLPSGGTRSPTR
ncbi:DUF2786 domain-containing protein [Actinacidiphila yeochonensis]|uniref:DUF2786 domain-containing protein n=1 Tax=Actinacidiphila yeochonensis TaxID=89050 RepID=UPI00056A7859|nr:DUF2786 domain-containing protein [Actinacidiphila yeochonensis]